MDDMLAFSIEQVSRLTGVSVRQLTHWDNKGFFVARYTQENRRTPFSRVYSFRDVVGLRTLAVLRNEHKVSLQELRKVKDWFAKHYDNPWAELTFYVGGGHVFFDDPESGKRMAGVSPRQQVMTFEMIKVADEIREAAMRLRDRTPDQIGRIERNRYTLHNAPRLAGTRIPTSVVWDFHEAGYGVHEIISQYPRLTPEDVQEALEYERQRRENARQVKQAS